MVYEMVEIAYLKWNNGNVWEAFTGKSSQVESKKVKHNAACWIKCKFGVKYNSMTACDGRTHGDRPANIGQLAHQ